MSKKSDIGKIALGAALGVGAGVLLAPNSGKETRLLLKEKMNELFEKVKNIDSEKVKKEFDKKIKILEKEIKSLDKEKFLTIAKEKAKTIKEKADELVQLAMDKGNETIRIAAEEVRKRAIVVTRDVLEKLENKQNENDQSQKEILRLSHFFQFVL